jgi:hypothetical protein
LAATIIKLALAATAWGMQAHSALRIGLCCVMTATAITMVLR